MADIIASKLVLDDGNTLVLRDADAQEQLVTVKDGTNELNKGYFLFSDTEKTAQGIVNGWRLNTNNDGLSSQASGYKILKYAVTSGEYLKVISDDRFQFQNSASVPSYLPNYRIGNTYETGTYAVRVPDGATYLIVSTLGSAHVYDEISTLSEEVDEIKGVLDDCVVDVGINSENLFGLITDITSFPSDASATVGRAEGWRLNNNGLSSQVQGYVILKYSVTSGDYVKVTTDDVFQFQNSASVPSTGTPNRVGITYDAGTYVLIVPEGATYLIISTQITGGTGAMYKASDTLMAEVERLKLGSWRGAVTSWAGVKTTGLYTVDKQNFTDTLPDVFTRYAYIVALSTSPKTMLVWDETGLMYLYKTDRLVPFTPSGSVSRLKGKKICYNGDSIAESRFSGFASNGGGYPYLIAQQTGGSYENKAVSGGTLSISSAGHHVCETISSMASDADLVCLEGGINDYWLHVPLGDFTESDFTGSLDETTVCGALESIFRQAINKWVGVPIVFVIVHKITTTAWTVNNAGYTFAQEREKLIGICKKYSIPYVDMWAEGGLNAYMSVLDNAYLNGGGNEHPDGCHPDVNGYKKYYVSRLIDMFERVLPYDE